MEHTVTTEQQKPVPPQGVIYVSEKAAKHVKHFCEKEAKPNAGLRASVKGGGCSGLTYVLALEDGPRQGDKVIEQGGIRIFVDAKSLLYLAGTTLDFSDGLNGKGFIFQNPNAKTTCGCGTSFGV